MVIPSIFHHISSLFIFTLLLFSYNLLHHVSSCLGHYVSSTKIQRFISFHIDLNMLLYNITVSMHRRNYDLNLTVTSEFSLTLVKRFALFVGYSTLWRHFNLILLLLTGKHFGNNNVISR